ncbi:hypothetical protein ACWGHM_34325 [Streptomyces sp. NPDC054904]
MPHRANDLDAFLARGTHGIEIGYFDDLHALLELGRFPHAALTGWVGTHPEDGGDMPMLLLYPTLGAGRGAVSQDGSTDGSGITETRRAVLDLFAAWGVEPNTLVEHPVLEGSDGVPVGFRVTRRKMGPEELRQAGLREQAWTGLLIVSE